MMIRLLIAMLVIAVAGTGTSSCAFFGTDVVLEGAVAQTTGDRVLVVSKKPANGRVGQVVSIYQRVEVPAIDPYRPAWHPLERVAKGAIEEITAQGAWVRILSGTVAPSGEIELRDEDE